jgi:uncharacterized membrane protein YedE/YeeE
MRALTYLVAGLVFGLGLTVSGMINPAKVLNFLDVAGQWDPSLAFVMGGGLVVTYVGYRFVLARPSPLFSDAFHLPTARHIDRPLVAGAVCFGVGWGLGGFCPGPAVTSIGLLAEGTIVFVPCMLAGMWVARFAKSRVGT